MDNNTCLQWSKNMKSYSRKSLCRKKFITDSEKTQNAPYNPTWGFPPANAQNAMWKYQFIVNYQRMQHKHIYMYIYI